MSATRWAAAVFLALSATAAPADEKPARTDRHADPLPEGAVARLGTTRLQAHTHCLAFSADGKLLATAGSVGTALVWDTTTGREVVRWKGNNLGPQVWNVALSPDGKTVATLDSNPGVL